MRWRPLTQRRTLTRSSLPLQLTTPQLNVSVQLLQSDESVPCQAAVGAATSTLHRDENISAALARIREFLR